MVGVAEVTPTLRNEFLTLLRSSGSLSSRISCSFNFSPGGDGGGGGDGVGGGGSAYLFVVGSFGSFVPAR